MSLAQEPTAAVPVSAPRVALGILATARPRQWLKNLVLLAPLFFAGADVRVRGQVSWESVRIALWAFGLFCIAASGVYLLNDAADRERDRLHPAKRLRPVAAGVVPVPVAYTAAALMAGAGLGGAYALRPMFGASVAAYLLLQGLYTTWLKRIVILDVFAIAAGFVLRVVAGAQAVQVPISSWLYVCTLFLALFLGLCKRRHELTLLEDDAAGHRAILAEYSTALIDQMIAVVTSATLMAYALYTLSEETIRKFGSDALKFTIPFVLFGIFRYLYLVHQRDGGGHPERALLGDPWLLGDVAAYALVVAWALYLR